jgi:hypothetical protein
MLKYSKLLVLFVSAFLSVAWIPARAGDPPPGSPHYSMIKVGGVDTNSYALNDLIVAGRVVSYKVDQMKTKPSFAGKISKDDKSIDGKWTDQTTRTSLHYVKVE